MNDRETVKKIVRELEKLHNEAYANENRKTEISFDLISAIFAILISDYYINNEEL